MKIIIIGGGIAGTTAAEEIRARSPEAEITIIEGEQHPCYSRVLLPHYVKDKVVREKVFLKTLEWYREKSIELMSGVYVKKIDVKNAFVLTNEDRELPFDKLLVAPGGEIDLLPDDRRGVSYLSTVDDADHLKALLTEMQSVPVEERKAVVYGGGFIALEYANIFTHFNIPFSVVMRGTGFWSRILSVHSQKVLADQAKKHGVDLFTEEPEPELLGAEEIMGVKLKDGRELPARILGVGIGSRLSDRLLKEAGIPCNKGILANEYLETGLQNVYTAGDAAEFMDTAVNRQLRYGNWLNALMQGRAVGKTMAGERTAFTLVSSYATNLLGMHVIFIGDTHKEAADEVVQTVSTPEVSEEVFVRGGKVVGAILIGDAKNRAKLTKAIGTAYGT